MANTLKIKRGTKATIPTLAAGEPGWCTDTYELFVGDGAINRPVGIAHVLATAANDFLVASGAGVFVKKTKAETQSILGSGGDSFLVTQVFN